MKINTKNVAIIPARSQSKGIKNKNIIELSGKELIGYTISCALKSKYIDRVIVSTDSKKYADIAKKYGAEVPFIRPKRISTDKSSDISFFKHAINYFNLREGSVPKLFIHLRPTTPFRDPKVIDKAIKTFMKSNYTALRSCHKMSESSYKTFEIKNRKLVTLCKNDSNIEKSNRNRQSFPVTYNANGYVDIIRTEMIIKNNIIHGDRVLGYVTDPVLEVDEKDDFSRLEYEIDKNPSIYKKIFSNEKYIKK